MKKMNVTFLILLGVGLNALVGCSSFEAHEDRRQDGLEMPAERINLMPPKGDGSARSQENGLVVPDHYDRAPELAQPVSDQRETFEAPVNHQEATPEQDSGYHSYYPSMRGYRVNRNVEIFPLDD